MPPKAIESTAETIEDCGKLVECAVSRGLLESARKLRELGSSNIEAARLKRMGFTSDLARIGVLLRKHSRQYFEPLLAIFNE